MVHYLEVTTTALLAMLCPLLVTSQEVFQAEVIIFFSLCHNRADSVCVME